MRGVLAHSILILLIATTAFAQGGAICLFTDDTGSGCPIEDTTPGLLQIYVVHSQSLGVTGSWFAAAKPECMIGVTWLTDTVVFPVTVGNSQDGVAIGYAACLFNTIHVLTINYSTAGLSEIDCAYPVLPYPGNPFVEAVGCGDNPLATGAGISYVNSTLPCECEALPLPPMLDVSTNLLSFYSEIDELAFDVFNAGDSTLVWSLSTNEPWITLTPSSGNDNETITVTVDRTGIPDGIYAGTIAVQSNGGYEEIRVVMYIPSRAILSVSPTSLDFGTEEVQRTLEITNAGEGTLYWTANSGYPWLSVTPGSGAGDGTLTVTVQREALQPGIQSCGVFINSNVGSLFVHASIEIVGQDAILSVLPSLLDFGENLSQRTFTIRNLGTGPLNWAVTPEVDWLAASPRTGSGNASVTVSIDRTTLAPGDYYHSIDIASNGGAARIHALVAQRSQTDPILAVSPTVIHFGPLENDRTFEITNIGVGTLAWEASEDEDWMTIAPASGTGDGVVTVTLDRSTVPDGYNTGAVAVTSNGGDAWVSITATEGTVLSVSPKSLTFVSAAENEKIFTIENTGTGTLNWAAVPSAGWISIDPSNGEGDTEVHVTVDMCAILPVMPSIGSISISSNGGTDAVGVTALRPSNFGVIPENLYIVGATPRTQTVELVTVCPDTAHWTAMPDASWVTVYPSSGVGSAMLEVTVTPPDWFVSGYEHSMVTWIWIVTPQSGSVVVTIYLERRGELPTEGSSWGRMKSKFKSE